MRTWAWYRLWQKVKPLLNVTRVEDEIKALEDKAAAAQANFEKEEKLRKELEASLAKLNAEKNDLLNRLQAESGTVADFHEKQNKLMSQKADLEAQLSVCRSLVVLCLNCLVGLHTHPYI